MEFLDLFLEEINVEKEINETRISSKDGIVYENEGNANWCVDFVSPPPQVTSRAIFDSGSLVMSHMGVLNASSTKSRKTTSTAPFINTPKVVQFSLGDGQPLSTLSPRNYSFQKESIEILSDYLTSPIEATTDVDNNLAVPLLNPFSCEDLEVQTNSCLVADLKTPPHVPYKSAADLSAPSGGDVAASQLTTPCSADLVSHGTSLGSFTQVQRINKSQQYSSNSVQRSSMLESSDLMPTPPMDPTLHSPSRI